MSKHDPRVTLQQMRDAARKAQSLCAGESLEKVTGDWMKVAALKRCFEVIGEAIKRLPAGLRERLS